jgi:hypothetical protein
LLKNGSAPAITGGAVFGTPLTATLLTALPVKAGEEIEFFSKLLDGAPAAHAIFERVSSLLSEFGGGGFLV